LTNLSKALTCGKEGAGRNRIKGKLHLAQWYREKTEGKRLGKQPLSSKSTGL